MNITNNSIMSSNALKVHLMLLILLTIVITSIVSCDKEPPNEPEGRILSHEDSLALGLIKEVPTENKDTTTAQPPTPPAKEVEAMIDGINYILNEDNLTAKVTWKNGSKYSGIIDIPETVQHQNNVFTVVAIGKGAFTSDTIKSITIPSSVTVIGEGAFWLSKVEKVRIEGEGLKTIEGMAFAQSGLYGGINIPNSVTKIGWRAFWNCGLTSINLPNGLTEIEKEVFRATPLKEVKLPDCLEIIGEAAFLSCPIESITLPATIREIGSEAFTSGNFKKILCYAIDVPKAEYNSFPFRLKNWRGWYNNNIYLYVPKQSLSLYRETEPWKNCISISAIENGILW